MTLSHKTKIFADVYDGDAEEAARIAGLSEQYGRRLVMDATAKGIQPACLEVQETIQQRTATENIGKIADRQERQAFWTKIMEGEEQETSEETNKETGETRVIRQKPGLSDRLRASELLGKSELDFGERHVDETPHTLADIAALMGQRRRRIASKALTGLEAPIVPPIEPIIDSKEVIEDE